MAGSEPVERHGIDRKGDQRAGTKSEIGEIEHDEPPE
jgi:hypothetical protein